MDINVMISYDSILIVDLLVILMVIFLDIGIILIVPPFSPTKSSTLTFETNHFFESHVMVSWMLLKLIEIL